jgi:hypothetical protein
VYGWIKEVKSGKRDLSNILPPGRVSDEGLDDCTGKALKQDPYLLTRRLAMALNIHSAVVRNHLTKSLDEMQPYSMGPHTLTAAQRAKCRGMADGVLQTLEMHTASHFHFLWAGAESASFYEYRHESVWAAS